MLSASRFFDGIWFARMGIAIAFGLFLCWGSGLAVAQVSASGSGDASGFSGFWEPKYTGGSGAFNDVFGSVEKAPLVAGIAPLPRFKAADPVGYGAKAPVDGSACRVLAFPFFMTSSPPFDILITNDEVLILTEREGGSRHIYTNRAHDFDHVVPSSNGDSVGHWEGKTLVIDTIGFSGVASVPGGGRRGPKTHLIEHYNTADQGQKLEVEFTWDDSSFYTKPHTYTLNYYRMSKDTYALEDWCDSGDPKEYQSVNGIPVIGNEAIPAARMPSTDQRGGTHPPQPTAPPK
jgi:hypothetical protein